MGYTAIITAFEKLAAANNWRATSLALDEFRLGLRGKKIPEKVWEMFPQITRAPRSNYRRGTAEVAKAIDAGLDTKGNVRSFRSNYPKATAAIAGVSAAGAALGTRALIKSLKARRYAQARVKRRRIASLLGAGALGAGVGGAAVYHRKNK